MRTLIVGIIALMVVACGRHADKLTFETRELSGEEVIQLGLHPVLAGDPGIDVTSLSSGTTGGGIVNALAGEVLRLITPGEDDVNAVLLGHAVPKGVMPIDLAGGKGEEKTYEKHVKSILGFTIIKAYYKISYQYGAKHKGKGSYLTNLKFTPLRTESEIPWNLKATALSEHPTNAGTDAKPVAKLAFSLTFTVFSKLGSRSATDEFTVMADTGELKETIRSLDE